MTTKYSKKIRTNGRVLIIFDSSKGVAHNSFQQGLESLPPYDKDTNYSGTSPPTKWQSHYVRVRQLLYQPETGLECFMGIVHPHLFTVHSRPAPVQSRPAVPHLFRVDPHPFRVDLHPFRVDPQSRTCSE